MSRCSSLRHLATLLSHSAREYGSIGRSRGNRSGRGRLRRGRLGPLHQVVDVVPALGGLDVETAP